ncbi:5'/3'-nucleotidase SurE [Romboutsia lituseburensis]|uniref:5'-nucleotidase SurE n=1 Tax=Romboutsia lituseburensis DSM 797 TaxID=1121325 RepID=A0A1G9ICY2_9FIRM|nr:5'/3'-nucleotidase SurE [Romboutsia lituseburensis]CEH33947.1 5'-nucleotidase SurE [Romboutsia lituseburensis]SDL23081.1 5'-nucleotidase /3'-nucleotidase /exopolyphosphatase [Romboutsia lituseburensis DSM 797]
MNILITNDDGIRADGIIELAKAMSNIANVYVVAPESQRSATGHAITIHSPIMVNEEFIADNINAYSISGTPADCVKLGIEGIFKDIDIDLVLSGINNGPNLGTDVIYSGTASAAIEGLVQNKPSIAISYNEFNVTKETYREASKHVVKIVDSVKDKLNILEDCILNVNIPNKEIKGTKVTVLGERKYENVMEERYSPYGKRYFWIGGKIKNIEQVENNDIDCVEEGYISITPVNIDMTNKNKVNYIKDLNIF